MPAPPTTDDQQWHTVLVFGGGDPPTELDRSRLPATALVIAADHGADHALVCGRPVDLVVGDLDSVSTRALAAASDAGAAIERHPREKDESDLELALRRALDHCPRRIVVTAVSGGRADHELANLLVIAGAANRDVDVDVFSGSDRFHVVTGRRRLEVEPDQIVTLLPVHGPAIGVTTLGLHYPLSNETLDAGTTRGISNVAAASNVEVEVTEGTVLVVLPGERT
ncbi:MAG: thiamine diphosphokinase [Acidimicrobiales bacterium]